MSWPPNQRERELAVRAFASQDRRDWLAEQLAHYREELLQPFESLRRDFEVLRDDKVTRELDALIRAARGKP